MNPLLSALVAAGLLSAEDADRLNRQLDSNAAREYAEQQLLLAWQGALSSQRDRLIEAVRASDGLLTVAQQNRLWAGENDRLWASVRESLYDVMSEQAIRATIASATPGTPLADSVWQLVNEGALEWVNDYYTNADAEMVGSIPNLNITSRTRFASAFLDWQRGELQAAGFQDGLPELIRSIEPVFGVQRSSAIAITETTRIFSQAEIAAGNASPYIDGWIYNTVADERVTDLCRSADGTVMMKGEGTFPDGLGPPPRHVRCRSFIQAISGPALAVLREQGLVQVG